MPFHPTVPNLHILALIVLAALAAMVLYQLYAVLGRRVGRAPEDMAPAGQGSAAGVDAAKPAVGTPDPSVASEGLAGLRARDPAFDIGHFLSGARTAYEMIVKAFAMGDRAVLKPLLSAPVMDNFDHAIAERETQGRTEEVEFLHPPRADFEGVELVGDLARASVRFLCELRSRVKDAAGEAVDDRRTAEIWTFERNLKGKNPNWTLIHVDAAEA